MTNKLIIFILTAGVIYRLFLTYNGNFLFNMDNARDMVDVREMVVLHKLRLIGPTSAIDGFYNGPAWYYLLAVPFLVSGGHPYASIIMEIALWAVGGFFLLKLVSRRGSWLVVPAGLIWISSNYVVLTNLYAFNPNPVILLTPLLIYLLVEYLQRGQGIFIILTFFLSGLFFNFEMNFGVFTPVIVLASLIFVKRLKYLKDKWFWAGAGVFILMLLSQVIFDLRHQFIMSKAVLNHLGESGGINILHRIQVIAGSFYNSLVPTLMNNKLLSIAILGFFLPVIDDFFRKDKKEPVVLVSLLFILVPFLGYAILPVTVNSWHWGAEMAAAIILIAYLLSKLTEKGILAGFISASLAFLIIWFGLANIANFFLNDFRKPNPDPSLYKNEIAAIDYVYAIANGRGFKVYTYLPSVYDYPYQYLFWWYGKRKYGYIPGEYAYAPHKPSYIPSQDKFQGRKDNLSDLVFLIKEPDRIKMRQAWENDFKNLELISKKIVGPIEVEVRTN